jgi:putative endonuclease
MATLLGHLRRQLNVAHDIFRYHQQPQGPSHLSALTREQTLGMTVLLDASMFEKTKPRVKRPDPPPGLLDHYSYVYMMGSSSRRALYTGVTANFGRRIYEHKFGLIEGFTRKYKCHRLVYYEVFENISEAMHGKRKLKAGGEKRRTRLWN